MKSLLALCADKKIEATIEGLLQRPEALGIGQVEFEIMVHPQRDPGCYHQAAAFLRPLRRSFEHAVVVFDRAWEGAPSQCSAALAAKVSRDLQDDWNGAADVVVIEPELEAWVWSDSPHVEEVLGWKNRAPGLRVWLQTEGLLRQGEVKPSDPKTAVERAIKMSGKRWTAGTCKSLSSKVGLARCQDISFSRLKTVLQGWFPPEVLT
jgi:hypothetical protein